MEVIFVAVSSDLLLRIFLLKQVILNHGNRGLGQPTVVRVGRAFQRYADRQSKGLWFWYSNIFIHISEYKDNLSDF